VATHVEFYPARAAEYGDGFRSFLKLGTTITGAEYANAHMVRERFSNRFQELFDEADVVTCPSMPVVSLPTDALPPDASAFSTPNPLLMFTAPFNLSRNPTLSLPCGSAAGGPPPSLQLVSRRLGESTLFQVGDAYERATEWHRQHPNCG
jgi:amidase